jgi:hypothetical protein
VPDTEEALKPVTQFTTLIPHFWYEIVGQIGPGAFFLMGFYLLGFRRATVDCFLQTYFKTASGEYQLFPLFILFVFTAHLAGGVLGSFSYCLVQWPFEKCSYYAAKMLAAYEHRGSATKKPALATTQEIERIRRQSTWVIWKRAPQLAIFFSRWDAMAFAARSMVLSAAILALYAHYGPPHVAVRSAAFLILLTITLGSIVSFRHYHELTRDARQQMLAVLDKKST